MDKLSDLKGHYRIVYSPDDGGYYADLWWRRGSRSAPVYPAAEKARAWARKHGGTDEH